jgi:hypothetical protein
MVNIGDCSGPELKRVYTFESMAWGIWPILANDNA